MINWKSESEFFIGDCQFTIDLTPGKNRRMSETKNFTLVKTKRFINLYLEIFKDDKKIKNILELGVFQGGGLVFLNEIFDPNKIVGIELSQVPIPALDQYIIEKGNKVKVHYGASQTDIGKLNQIISNEFNEPIDLIVDDASHLYSFTKESFINLFPKLKPKGLYIIEDWAWSFRKAHQDSSNPWYTKPAMANLIIECFEEIATGNAIESIQVFEEFAVIKKSEVKTPKELFANKARRGRTFPQL